MLAKIKAAASTAKDVAAGSASEQGGEVAEKPHVAEKPSLIVRPRSPRPCCHAAQCADAATGSRRDRASATEEIGCRSDRKSAHEPRGGSTHASLRTVPHSQRRCVERLDW